MKTETWLPLVTFILGLVGALATEAFRDRRVSNRERLARRAELQRTTLLDLQEALRELSRRAHEVWNIALGMEQEDAAEREQLAKEPGLHLRTARERVQLLTSRVEDDQARELAAGLLHATRMVWSGERRADEKMIELGHTYSVAIDRIGELLRERY